MFKRIVGYIRTWFRRTAENAMDPEIEIEQAIDEARKQDQRLRSQAAKVIAHRTKLEERIERQVDTVADSREMAKQALLRAEKAKSEGDDAGLTKWMNSASSLAMKLQASENNVESLKEQYEIAISQSDEAKRAVEQNAMRVQELAAKRMELVGKLEQAKMQEAVNGAMESLNAAVEHDAPSLSRVEDKIGDRLAIAKANSELRSATPEGAESELREAVSLARADDKLAELRAELGLGSIEADIAPELEA
ncbi:MAG: phage shock protein A [Candidatus Poriferisodalaceae bacterium]|jgi:phage shock protein A